MSENIVLVSVYLHVSKVQFFWDFFELNWEVCVCAFNVCWQSGSDQLEVQKPKAFSEFLSNR